MIIFHPIRIPLAVNRNELPVNHSLAHRISSWLPGIEHPIEGHAMTRVRLNIKHDINGMRPILGRWIRLSFIHLIYNPHRSRKSITQGAIDNTLLLLQIYLDTIGPTAPHPKLSIQIGIQQNVGMIFKIYHIMQELIISVQRKFQAYVVKGFRNTKRQHIGYLRFDKGVGRKPNIQRVPGCRIGRQLRVLKSPGVVKFQLNTMVKLIGKPDPGFKAPMSMIELPACIITAVCPVVIGIKTRNRIRSLVGERTQTQTIFNKQTFPDRLVVANVNAALQCIIMILIETIAIIGIHEAYRLIQIHFQITGLIDMISEVETETDFMVFREKRPIHLAHVIGNAGLITDMDIGIHHP